jgi:hypothetical protein
MIRTEAKLCCQRPIVITAKHSCPTRQIALAYPGFPSICYSPPFFWLISLVLTFVSAPIPIETAKAQQSATEQETYAIGVDAYHYFYALRNLKYRGYTVELWVCAGGDLPVRRLLLARQ